MAATGLMIKNIGLQRQAIATDIKQHILAMNTT